MKKQIRLTLLFALIVTLLLGTLAAIPFSAFADDPQYTLTVKVVNRSGDLIEEYGKITNDAGGGYSRDSEQQYSNSTGTTITLTVHADGGYSFVGWKDDPASKINLGPGANGETLSFTIGEENVTRYVVFEPTEYDIYFVGAKSGQNDIPEIVKSKYGTDAEKHPSYPTPDKIKHTYGTATLLDEVIAISDSGTPTHSFAGWKAYDASGFEIALIEETVGDDETEKIYSIGGSIGTNVYLVPQWQPLQFTVTRIDRIGTPDNYEETELGSYEEARNYGSSVSGKDFGEVAEYIGYWFNDSDETLYTQEVVGISGAIIYRYYTPCEYTVTFDVNAPVADGITERGIETMDVTYKGAILQKLPAVPKCTGYQFMGYYYVTEEEILYYDRFGHVGENTTWEIPSDATLTAKWELQKHEVIVRVMDGEGNDCSAAVQVLINGSPNPGAMDYGTQGEVVVTVLPDQNKKLTKWDGKKVAHTLSITREFEIGESNVVFIVQILPVEATPALKINYAKETLEGFLLGEYRFEAEGVFWKVNVRADGSVINADAVSLSELFGKTLSVIRPGLEDRTADGEVQELVLNARPATLAKEEISYEMIEDKQARELIFRVPNAGQTVYEIAYTTSAKEKPENWTTDLHLTGLEAGTPYTVWIRARATETAPHSEATRVLKNYEFSHLVDLKPLFIILLCLLALQLVALIFLLVSRRRARMNAVAAPLFAVLAVKLIPAGFFPWVIVLTIAVVGLQIVLICLALQIGVIWKKRTEKKKKSEPESTPAEFTLFGEETKPAEEKNPNEDNDE